MNTKKSFTHLNFFISYFAFYITFKTFRRFISHCNKFSICIGDDNQRLKGTTDTGDDNITFRDNPNHSTIVENCFVRNHSIIVGKQTNLVTDSFGVESDIHSNSDSSIQQLRTFGVFHNYPFGIVNPAFTGMFLCENLFRS